MYLGVFRLAGLQREKMTPKERQAIRAEILDAAHSVEGGSKFVVEGARVVCTSMVEGQEDFEGEDFSDYGSESLMEKLSDEERAENLATVNEAFERKNAGRNAHLHNPLNRCSSVTEGREERASRRDVRQAIGNEDVASGGFFNLIFNGGRLLDHMDIKFSPFFGEGLVDEEDEESSAVEKNKNKMVGNIRKGASAAGVTKIGGALINSVVLGSTAALSPVKAINKTKAAVLEALSEEEPRGKCKYSKDNKCLPRIEDLMWKDTDGYVRLATGQQIAGSETLLKNDAYMFCHRGQGILYIESSGQHQRRMRDLLDEQAEARDAEEEPQIDEDEVAYYREKALNNEFTPNFALEPSNYADLRLTTFSGGPMTNPRRIILHQTAGWPWGTVGTIHADHLDIFEGGRGIAYHFVVETGLNQYGDDIVGPARVVQGRPLNIQGWHTGGLNHPASEDAIGIAVPGNFTEDYLYGVIPITDINKNGIVDRLIEIIAECLILFPQIPRVNLAQNPRTHERNQELLSTDSEGVFGHADVNSSNCPGVMMGDWDIIRRAIDLADSLDGGR